MLSDREAWDEFRDWAWDEPEPVDLPWKRKRRVLVEEEEDDGWKCDEEE